MAILDIKIIGSTSGGKVWGTNPYAKDSDFSVAAVHAGLVSPGQVAYIRVTDVGNLNNYAASTSNGVTTLPWSTSVPAVKLSLLSAFQDKEIIGSTSGGAVWGSNPYTVDSDISVAAVHAGLVLPGERALIRIADVGTLNSFTASYNNGVSTLEWNFPYEGSLLSLAATDATSDLGYEYTYEDWYVEFASTLLKNIDKTTAILIGKRIATYYTTNSVILDETSAWYGFYRKPDAEGLAQWTRKAFNDYAGSTNNLNLINQIFSSPPIGSLDYNRIRTSNKVFLEGFGRGDFYDRGSTPEGIYPGYPQEQLSLLEAEKLVLDLYKSIGRGPSLGNLYSEISEQDYSYWVNRIITQNLTVSNATTLFNNSIDQYIEDNPDDGLTRYILTWRANYNLLNAPSVSADYFYQPTQNTTSTYVPSADGSTRTLWAGIRNGVGRVSIFSNPDNYAGDDSPLISPLSHLERIHFDTSFKYLNIIAEGQFTINFEFRNNNNLILNEGTNITEVYTHNLGYTPVIILYDLDTNQAIAGNSLIQNENNTSFRILYALADNSKIYLKEKYFVRSVPLSSLSKSFRILVFNSSAGVS